MVTLCFFSQEPNVHPRNQIEMVRQINSVLQSHKSFFGGSLSPFIEIRFISHAKKMPCFLVEGQRS